MVGVRVVGGHSHGWGLVAAHGYSLSMGGAPLSVVEAWFWWAGCHCPWGGVLVVRVCWSCMVTLRKSSSTWHTGWVCHVNGFMGCVSVALHCSWVIEKVVVDVGTPGWACHVSGLVLGVVVVPRRILAFVVKKVAVDVACPAGCATSVAWW